MHTARSLLYRGGSLTDPDSLDSYPPVDRDPPSGQTPLDRDPHTPRQGPPGQRPRLPETPLDRDPLQWTETPLDIDYLGQEVGRCRTRVKGIFPEVCTEFGLNVKIVQNVHVGECCSLLVCEGFQKR